MLVNLTRVDKENNMPMGLVSMLDSELDSSADVVLLLADKSVVKAHKCFLSVSPVLKEVLMSLDCRLDKMVHISMPDFNKRTVLSFIQFLYNGFVDLDRNHKELYRLFKALKVNPPVITERRPNCMENVGKVKVVEMMVDEVLTVRDECNIDNNEKQKTDVMEGDETSKLVSMSISSQDVEDQTEEKRNDADNESTNLMTSSSLSDDLMMTTSSLSGLLVSRVASAVSSDGKDEVWGPSSQLSVNKSNGSGPDRSMLYEYVKKEIINGKLLFICSVCGKSNSQKINAVNHVESIHFPHMFTYSCKFCGKTLKTKNSLYVHISTKHPSY